MVQSPWTTHRQGIDVAPGAWPGDDPGQAFLLAQPLSCRVWNTAQRDQNETQPPRAGTRRNPHACITNEKATGVPVA